MLLTISTTHRPATDLGFLLHKSPAHLHSADLSIGKAHVFYPEATPDRCTVALVLEIDPVGLIRTRRGSPGFALDQYVNDRPYAASSFLSVALSRVFGSAMKGTSKERPELAGAAIPFSARIPVLPARSADRLVERLFEPLGYAVSTTAFPLDDTFPEWGQSDYYSAELQATVRLSDLLTHLYVLVPVLDDDKHYWVGDDEVDKLLRHGEGWLTAHPERDTIVRRYLKHRRSLAVQAIAQLVDAPKLEESERRHGSEEAAIEDRISLNEQRLDAVMDVVRGVEAKRVIDLGCGEGRLLRAMLDERSIREIVGMDVSHRSLEIATRRLRFDQMAPMQKQRITLIHGSLTYRDKRLEGFDVATVIEVVEHLDPSRLASFERVVFEFARPSTVVMTTPNVEYNVRFESLPAGRLRHRDHRFEWTREQYQGWAAGVAARCGYAVEFKPVGPPDPLVGPPTQMGVFTRVAS